MRLPLDLLGPCLALIAACARLPPPSERPPIEPPAFTSRIAGAGRTVLLIPDLCATGSVWDTTVAHLRDRFETHVIEVAGFAGNPPIAGPLMPALRSQLARYLRERGASDVVLIGHMFGGSVAYWLAMTEPDLIGAVVAIDSPPSTGTGDAEENARWGEVRRSLATADAASFARMQNARFATMMGDEAQARRLGDRAGRSWPPLVAEALHDRMTRDLRAYIGDIRAPVLAFLTGGNIPPEAWTDAQRFYREQLVSLPRHHLVVVPQSRHYLMIDAPDVFLAELDRFLTATRR